MGDVEEQIRALSAQGKSIRDIERELGIDRGKVWRVLKKLKKLSAPAPAVPVVEPKSSVTARNLADDSELTSADLDMLDLSPGDLARVLNPLERYRTQRAPAVFGERGAEALRRLQAHPCWTMGEDSGVAAVPGAVPEFPGGRMSTHVRDGRIVELRRQGWTLAAIVDAVGMSEGGVSRAVRRLEDDPDTDAEDSWD
jgi:DNA-binding Lrp family transcriptional regulator